MIKSWKDPDTGLVHVIGLEETAREHPRGMPGLIDPPFEKIVKRFFRRVHTCCGIMMQLDSDEFLIAQGDSALSVLSALSSPILRPWLTGRGAPTCVVCAASKPSVPMCNDWGSKLRGA